MASELQVCVALFVREPYSYGRHRQIFGYEAYHWAIMVVYSQGTTEFCDAYEATDASEIDPVTWRMNNPDMDWWIRTRTESKLLLSSKLLGRLVIGTIADGTSRSDLGELFSQVPKPVKNTDPQQSCVTWVVDAIQALQDRGLVEPFDIGKLKDQALFYADRRMAKEESRDVLDYSELQS